MGRLRRDAGVQSSPAMPSSQGGYWFNSRLAFEPGRHLDQNRAVNVGYSGKPVVVKLGIKPGMRVAFSHEPDGYVEALQLPPVEMCTVANSDLDFVQLFVTTLQEFEERFPTARESIKKSGQVWVSWPKGGKKAGVEIDENVVRDTGLDMGMVDVKVIAVDEKWSGLKFVFRLKDR